MKRILIWSLFLLLLGPSWAGGAKQPFLLVLSREIKPYLDFAEGFKKNHPHAKVLVLPADLPFLSSLLAKRPYAVVAVGTKALKTLKDLSHHPETLFFYALVVSPEDVQEIFPQAHCGLYLRLPPEKTFPLIRGFWERLRRPPPAEDVFEEGAGKRSPLKLFIPYVAERNQNFVRKAQQVGLRLGLLVEAAKIKNLASLKKILFDEDFDLLYAIPDPLYATEESISFVTKTCLLRKKAVCGYNRFFYQKGALLAFVFNYEKIGEFAGKYFEQNSCQSLPAPFEMLVNQKILKLLGWGELEGFGKKDLSGGGK